MFNFDNPRVIKKLDKSLMLSSIEMIPNQCKQAWEEIKKIPLPKDYQNVEKIVVSGMGGSALGAHVIKSLFNQDLKQPLEIVNDYFLPGYVDNKTLVILSSYSGSTEETLRTAFLAKEKRAKILGITTGGKLGEFLKENNYLAYIFKPNFNPCNQPRIGLGYSIVGQIGLLAKLGFLKIEEGELLSLFEQLEKEQETIQIKTKQLIKKLQNKIIVIIGAEHLSGNAHILANQINENSKVFTSYFLLPELNHHLLEGLKNPKEKKLIFLFLVSNLYSEKIKKRLFLTKEIVEKNKIKSEQLNFENKTKIKDVFTALQLGSYLSFYLSIFYNQDPSPIPWVDYLKKKLV